MSNIHLEVLENELNWFTEILDTRFKQYFENENEELESLDWPAPPGLSSLDSPYARLIRSLNLNVEERIAIVLCLVPYLVPRLLDVFLTKNKTFDRPFTEFGGYVRDAHSSFLPTGETLLFILSGGDTAKRLAAMKFLDRDHILYRERILEMELVADQYPSHTGVLKLTPEMHAHLIRQKAYRPDFGARFPARRITTQLDWEDLILNPFTRGQLDEIFAWAKYGDILLKDWGMRKKIRPGYRSLFYGPPGTGKTMMASLLGKITGRDVYLIDLSMVISKYIGETEKNLSRVFDQAEHKGWILFFDEADALFGKRTQIQDAHDRYANQEVSYLLQRIELFDGITILASNLRNNLDDAFARRFESVIHFPMPGPEERLRIWQQGLPPKAELSEDINLEDVAKKYELSGGGIMNVIRYASLKALKNNGEIRKQYLEEGVRKEYTKEGKGL
jgi:hypothetical protein